MNPGFAVRLSNSGQILLRYKGENEDIFNLRSVSEAHFTFNQDAITNINKPSKRVHIKFDLAFKDFFGNDIVLDLENMHCEFDNEAIGIVEHFEISVNNTHILISGMYNHHSIMLLHYEDNRTIFEFAAPLEKSQMHFIDTMIKHGAISSPVFDWRK